MAKKSQKEHKPRQILLSKRANIFYLERARVLQKDERVLYVTDTGEDVEQFFNIPERNTMFLLLGKGTSITDAAIRRLADSNVIIGFCGSGGSPLFGSVDPVFLKPESEYRPTEYMQSWASWWFDEKQRLEKSKRLLVHRLSLTEKAWHQSGFLAERKITVPSSAIKSFEAKLKSSETVTQLLSAEAEWARKLYHWLAARYRIENFSRREGAGAKETIADRVNAYLDHGNYIAYGYAALTLNALGLSFSFPLLHGKTRRGALVFDIADLLKDAYVMPLAFEMGSKDKSREGEFRARLIETIRDSGTLDGIFSFVQDLAAK